MKSVKMLLILGTLMFATLRAYASFQLDNNTATGGTLSGQTGNFNMNGNT